MKQPQNRIDPSADFLRADTRHALEIFFSPRSVAVVGASEREDSVGRAVLWNLVQSPFGGTVFPVNAKRGNVLGIKAYPSVGAVPEPVDLAVVVTPAPTVPGVIRECAAAGVRGAIILSAGFKETGAEGARLEEEVLAIARAARMRIIGPNCLGVMSPLSGLNATLAGAMARKGEVAFLSQSGALQAAILDWSIQENVGFSAFVSLGSMLDVGWGDLIDYLDHDGRTKSILIYMESIGDARAFLSAAREVALRKPIIVLKGGRTAQAARAAASHTGSLAGSDEVLTAAFRRSGVLRVDTIADLFNMADTLSKQPRREAGASASSATRADRESSPPTRWCPEAASWRSSRRPPSRSSPRCCRPTGAAATPSTCSATPTPNGTKRPWRSPSRTPPTTGSSSSSRRRRWPSPPPPQLS